MSTVNIKLAPGADRQQVLRAMEAAPGVRKVVRTFPEETSPDLAGLYLLEVESTNVDSLLRRLRRSPGVEYAEVTGQHKLIRPRRPGNPSALGS